MGGSERYMGVVEGGVGLLGSGGGVGEMGDGILRRWDKFDEKEGWMRKVVRNMAFGKVCTNAFE